MDDSMNGREMTFGEKAVGLTFNPSGDGKVFKIKTLMAEVIDLVDSNGYGEVNSLENLCFTTAVQQLILAQMAAVKAVTFEK